jgi:menaquinone-dependent protoporphyrinogen oxidase
MRILVAYATKYGATAGIAERIGRVLQDAGLSVDVLLAEQVDDLTPYAGAVIGSALYVGRWRKEAATLLESQETALAELPVWLFSSGPTGDDDAQDLVGDFRFPEALQPIADRIGPRDTVLFHGSLDPKRLNLVEKLAIKALSAPLGDFRDWDAIGAWAKSIAEALLVRNTSGQLT